MHIYDNRYAYTYMMRVNSVEKMRICSSYATQGVNGVKKKNA